MSEEVSPEMLLTIWEHGRRLTFAGRGRVMLRALGLDEPAVGRLSLGQCDAMLMDLRARVFGVKVSSLANCPVCGDLMEVTFDLQDVRSRPPGDPASAVPIEIDGYTLQARPPCLDDLLWLEQLNPDADLRSALIARCIIEASHAGQQLKTTGVPEAVATCVSRALAEADPQADVRLELTCVACGHIWTALFDIVSFFWQELESWVWRMAGDVDALAARYGWGEGEILAMSPDRRALYLEVARA